MIFWSLDMSWVYICGFCHPSGENHKSSKFLRQTTKLKLSTLSSTTHIFHLLAAEFNFNLCADYRPLRWLLAFPFKLLGQILHQGLCACQWNILTLYTLYQVFFPLWGRLPQDERPTLDTKSEVKSAQSYAEVIMQAGMDLPSVVSSPCSGCPSSRL